MAGTLHFGALIGLVALTGVVLVRGMARPTWKRVVVGLLAGLGSTLVLALGLHGCDAGQPLMQWALPALCLVAAVLFVGDRRARAGLVAGAVTVMLGLGLHYVSAVHGPTWIGNPHARVLAGRAGLAEWHTSVTGLWRRPPPAIRAE